MKSSCNDRVAQRLASLRNLVPLIAANRDAFDRDRRLPGEVFGALAEAGLFRLWLPEELDGAGCSAIEFMEIVEAAAALDGSVGWLIGNGSGMSRVSGYLGLPVVKDWFSEPRAFIVSATGAVGRAIQCQGGYRVSGRWPFGSGSHHATRFMGVASVSREGQGESPAICCYFAPEEVTIEDTWNVSGLRGTGSCDFEVRDAFVPHRHTHLFVDPPPTTKGDVYRLPTMSVFPWTVSVVPLGIARGLIDAFVNVTNTKVRAGIAQRERETVQMSLGRAEALHGAGRAYLIAAIEGLAGGPPRRCRTADKSADSFSSRMHACRRKCVAHSGDIVCRSRNDIDLSVRNHGAVGSRYRNGDEAHRHGVK